MYTVHLKVYNVQYSCTIEHNVSFPILRPPLVWDGHRSSDDVGPVDQTYYFPQIQYKPQRWRIEWPPQNAYLKLCCWSGVMCTVQFCAQIVCFMYSKEHFFFNGMFHKRTICERTNCEAIVLYEDTFDVVNSLAGNV